MTTIVPGPTYAEMRDPATLPAKYRQAAQAARHDEKNPANLFNITWRRDDGSVSYVILPPALTGVAANVIVLVGAIFPTGSHKVGPAYATLAEAEAIDGIHPGTKIIVGPSTGNFGIGTAYVSLLKGYRAVVVMPDTMSRERYQRIRQYGADLDLTPGSESDVILTLDRTYQNYVRNSDYLVLAQFELLPNYRFHYHVTGNAALAAAAEHGNGRVAAFVSAPGSAGTLAAGDAIKKCFSDATIVALEPRECSTLYNGGQGQHRIEGIGDKMVTLIHNVLTTDYVALIHDNDCVRGLQVLHTAGDELANRFGLANLNWRDSGSAIYSLRTCLGISGICNIIGAIKTAKLLELGPNDNIVTIATDRFDRYPSVLDNWARQEGPITTAILESWAERIFHQAGTSEILDVRGTAQKARLHQMKRGLWSRFGYTDRYLTAMESMTFWDEEAGRAKEIDQQIQALREST